MQIIKHPEKKKTYKSL